MPQHVAKANLILDTDGNTVDVSIDKLQEDVQWLKTNGTALSPEQVASLAKVPVIESQLDETNKKTIGALNTGFNMNTNNGVIVTFIDDDGHLNVIDRLKPIFEAKNSPCCVAVIGTISPIFQGNNIKIMKQLQDTYGWECLSHTTTDFDLDVKTPQEIETDCIAWHKLCVDNGLFTNSIAYPHGKTNPLATDILAKYFNSGFVTTPGINNNNNELDVYKFKRIALGSFMPVGQDTFEYFKGILDNAVAGDWIVFMTHCGTPPIDTNNALIQQVLNYTIDTKGYKVVNVQEGLRTHGNIVKTSGFSVTSKGNVYSNKYSMFNIIPTKLETDSPTGTGKSNRLNICEVNGWTLGSGILTEYIGAEGWQYQEFRKTGSLIEIYTRKWTGSKWNGWEKMLTSKGTIIKPITARTVNANSTITVTIYDTSISGNDNQVVQPVGDLSDGIIWTWICTGSGAIKIKLTNVTSADISLAETQWRIKSIT